jgi:ribosomal protein L11 methyltransferase
MEACAAIWLDLSPNVDAELASSELFDRGALGIEELDTPPGALRAWLPLDWDRTLLPDGWTVLGDGAVEAKDWDLSWRLQQEPLKVTDRLTVVPPWVDAPEGVEFVLRMEAKQAFGTGGHESTRLASHLLEAIPLGGSTVFDIGAGTGILAFYAGKLGAGHLELCDIDPDAIPCLEENAQQNGARDWNAWAGSVEKVSEGTSFDLVIANMLRTEFFPMRTRVARMIPPGGRLILSGYLATEKPQVVDWFAAEGLELEHERTENDWWACVGRRKA